MRRVPGLSYGVLDDLLGYALRRAQNAIYVDFSETVADPDMTPQRFAALVLICENAPLAQTVFAEAMGIDRSVAARLVDWLCARGLVVREPHGTDSRQWLLRDTASGRAQRDETATLVRIHDVRITAELGDDADVVRRALQRIAEADWNRRGK